MGRHKKISESTVPSMPASDDPGIKILRYDLVSTVLECLAIGMTYNEIAIVCNQKMYDERVDDSPMPRIKQHDVVRWLSTCDVAIRDQIRERRNEIIATELEGLLQEGIKIRQEVRNHLIRLIERELDSGNKILTTTDFKTGKVTSNEVPMSPRDKRDIAEILKRSVDVTESLERFTGVHRDVVSANGNQVNVNVTIVDKIKTRIAARRRAKQTDIDVEYAIIDDDVDDHNNDKE